MFSDVLVELCDGLGIQLYVSILLCKYLYTHQREGEGRSLRDVKITKRSCPSTTEHCQKLANMLSMYTDTLRDVDTR